MTGTTPPGVTGEQAAARWVRGTFGKIARHYDLLNHLLSFNLDRRWRARTVERVANLPADSASSKAPRVVLDLCCGTGDLMLALANRMAGASGARVMGSDFCHPMLIEAQRKIVERSP